MSTPLLHACISNNNWQIINNSADADKQISEYDDEFKQYLEGTIINMHVPQGTTKIKEGTFDYLFKLKTVYIPDSVLTLEPQNIVSLEQIVFNGVSTIIESELLVPMTSNEFIKIYVPWSPTERIVTNDEHTIVFYNYISEYIPPNTKEESQYSKFLIGEYTKITANDFPQDITALYRIFKNNTIVESVELPPNVIILTDTFNGCTSLNNVELNDSLIMIGLDAFRSCSSLEQIQLPSKLQTIGKFAFAYSGLKNIVIPDSVTDIQERAFGRMPALESVQLGKGITKINLETFTECPLLTNVIIPNTVTDIGNNAFRDCTGLTSVTIPNSVTIIGNDAFSGCTGLTSITIPNNVTRININAFYDCTGLTSVVFKGTPTTLGITAFSGCTQSNLHIYVPWAENAVASAPWGARNATIHYNYDTSNM